MVVPQGQGCVQQRQWQVAVPAAPPRPPRFHLWASTTASTSVAGTVMRITLGFGPAGSHRRAVPHRQLPGRRQLGSHAPPPTPGRHLCPQASPARPSLACSTFHSRALLLSLSTPASTLLLASFSRLGGLPLMGNQAQRVEQVAQVLLQTTVEMLNVPARPPSPGSGQTQEVLHAI